MGGRDGVGAVRDVFVGVGERGEGLAEVPGDVGREHAQEHMRTDPLGSVVKDGPQVEVIDLDDTEITFDISEVFVRGDNSGGVQGLGVSTGADDVEPPRV